MAALPCERKNVFPTTPLSILLLYFCVPAHIFFATSGRETIRSCGNTFYAGQISDGSILLNNPWLVCRTDGRCSYLT